MGKVLLFHNNMPTKPPKKYRDYMEQPAEYMVRELCCENPYGRRNTGTYLMTDTLKKIIDADELIPREYKFNERVDTVVTNILHRVGSNLKVDFEYWNYIFDNTDRIVPLSMGFAFTNGNIEPIGKEMKYFVEKLADRCELGVRTCYDAEFLNSCGIKNVRVIGCPSLFWHLNRDFIVDDSKKAVNKMNANFTTDFANLGISQRIAVETHWPLLLWFKWIYERNTAEIDLTLQKPPFAEINDIHAILLSYSEVHDFYTACGRYYYGTADWINGLKYNDFSMGSRFHGNVAAILAGIPTLPVNVDLRMKGMNDFFKIPSINIEEFDIDKPLEFYREKADYTEFNKNYKIVYDNFCDYCSKNGVPLRLE